MFYFINKIILGTLPFIPKNIIKAISNRYIAGIDDEEALKTIKKLNGMNLSATIDILGEHTKNVDESDSITNRYIKLYKEISKNNLDCNISIKPSHIGSDISLETFTKNLALIHNEADNNNNFLRIDMENSTLTDITINAFKNNYKKLKNIGIVIQAYLYRSEQDINNLESGMNIRLCKGIYNENETIAIKNPKKINDNYLSLLGQSLKKNIFVGIATHDINLIEKILCLIEENNFNKKQFEFQVLYGVPMKKTIQKLLALKYKVRVYVPYGDNWYEYSMRRLNENPNISKYVIKNFFTKNFYK